MTSKELGQKGEYLAKIFLEQKGFEFIRANYRTPHGEIDLIMQENDEIVFIEVKTRTFHSASEHGRGLWRINKEKERHIIRASRQFLREETILTKGLFPRYDAVELYLESRDSEKIHVIHTPCVFAY